MPCKGVWDIPWTLDVHEHGAHFVAQIREDLEEAFPTQRKGPYRDFITKDTWDIRGQRRTIRRRLYINARLDHQPHRPVCSLPGLEEKTTIVWIPEKWTWMVFTGFTMQYSRQTTIAENVINKVPFVAPEIYSWLFLCFGTLKVCRPPADPLHHTGPPGLRE